MFLTRYIRSQNPPAELLEETQYKMVRRKIKKNCQTLDTILSDTAKAKSIRFKEKCCCRKILEEVVTYLMNVDAMINSLSFSLVI